LSNLFIIARRDEAAELNLKLTQKGFTCTVVSDEKDIVEQIAEQTPDLVLLEIEGYSGIRETARSIKREQKLPIIALIRREAFENTDEPLLGIDDFIAKPCDINELVFRIRRLLRKNSLRGSNELIVCDDLVVDLTRCEVSLSGLPVALTFREYELLKFLADNKGRVFTREALLNKVWGYDYYGGDRTVDVHIRRLRSKIEDPVHSFIETVRNIGYRFKEV
jgi:DNA-binding response OmpR family regulator